MTEQRFAVYAQPFGGRASAYEVESLDHQSAIAEVIEVTERPERCRFLAVLRNPVQPNLLGSFAP